MLLQFQIKYKIQGFRPLNMHTRLNPTLHNFLTQYTIQYKIPETKQTVLRENFTNTLILMKQIDIENQQTFIQSVLTLQQQMQLNNEHLLSVLDYFYINRTKIIVFYQYCGISLSQQIYNRKKQQKFFAQQQIWNILLSIVCSSAYLQEKQIGHGCISPLDIFITEEGIIKLADPTLATSNPFNLQVGYYYSPQILQFFSTGQSENFDIYKSDVFTLGMTFLEVILLEPATNCIDYERYKFNYAQFNSRLEKIRLKYSSQLFSILIWMIQPHKQQRPNFIELRNQLAKLFIDENGNTIKQWNTQSNSQKAARLLLQSGQTHKRLASSKTVSYFEVQEHRCLQENKGLLNNQSEKKIKSKNGKNKRPSNDKTRVDSQYAEQNKQVTTLISHQYQISQSMQQLNSQYTDPYLLNMMKNDVEQIIQKRKRSSFQRDCKYN